jgi:hypothetical protein
VYSNSQVNNVQATLSRRLSVFTAAKILLVLSCFELCFENRRAFANQDTDIINRNLEQCFKPSEAPVAKGCEKYYADLARNFFLQTGKSGQSVLGDVEVVKAFMQGFCKYTYENSSFYAVRNADSAFETGRIFYMSESSSLWVAQLERSGECTLYNTRMIGRTSRNSLEKNCSVDTSFSVVDGALEVRHKFLECVYRKSGYLAEMQPNTYAVVAIEQKIPGRPSRLKFSIGEYVYSHSGSRSIQME